MPDWREHFNSPDDECIENGDPYLAEIRKGEDLIFDHTYNAEWLKTPQPDEIRRLLRTYELTTLTRWWWLE